jgi:hypothetical protein
MDRASNPFRNASSVLKGGLTPLDAASGISSWMTLFSLRKTYAYLSEGASSTRQASIPLSRNINSPLPDTGTTMPGFASLSFESGQIQCRFSANLLKCSQALTGR